jgi:hypothetical protein
MLLEHCRKWMRLMKTARESVLFGEHNDWLRQHADTDWDGRSIMYDSPCYDAADNTRHGGNYYYLRNCLWVLPANMVRVEGLLCYYCFSLIFMCQA